MEPLKTQQHIISLGEQLVNSLGKAFDVGPVARWMSHYIAEQMAVAETATGEARLAAQQRCFDTILKLWSQRAAIPGNARPFSNFEPLFEVLERLDLETPSFYSVGTGWSAKDEPDGDVAKIVQLVTSIDETARTLIRTLLGMAATMSKDETTLGYLRAAQEDIEASDARLVFRMISVLGSEDEPEDEPEEKRREREVRQLDELDRFAKLAHKVRRLVEARTKKRAKQESKRKKDSP